MNHFQTAGVGTGRGRVTSSPDGLYKALAGHRTDASQPPHVLHDRRFVQAVAVSSLAF